MGEELKVLATMVEGIKQSSSLVREDMGKKNW
jgi:hypothetical protein